MQISIISTTVTTKPTTRGSYQELEVVYKNLTFQGKVESKKLMSFGGSVNAFKVLAEAQTNSVWEVTVVKNDKGYNDWTAVSAATGTPDVQPSIGAVPGTKPSTTPRSTYETPEERAQRQVLIVRQSSLSSAVSTLSVGAKNAPKPDEVIKVAQAYEAYVFGIADPGPTGFDDIPDLPPEIK